MEQTDRIMFCIGDRGYVDFALPCLMSSIERKQFTKLLSECLDGGRVDEEHTVEFRQWRIGERKLYARSWEIDERNTLLQSINITKTARLLGRSEEAVILQNGTWLPRFLFWCDNKGKNWLKGDTRKLIEQFLREQKEFRTNLKALRKQLISCQKEFKHAQSRDVEILKLKNLGIIRENGVQQHEKNKKDLQMKIKETETLIEKLEKEEY